VKRRLLLGAAAATLVGVAVWLFSARRQTPPESTRHDAPLASSTPAPSDARTAEPVEPEVTVVDEDASFRLLVFTVRIDAATFRVLDLDMKRDLEGALARSGASLVVNGGFFDASQKPEGLVVSEGRELSPKSETLGGGILSIADGRAELAAAETFVPTARADFALQARPRLVVGGKVNIGRDDGKTAERTALSIRNGARVLEVIVARGDRAGDGPTLKLFAEMLASRGCDDALNLDGGPSTGIAWRARDGSHALEPRGPLRHAIAIDVRRD
jgi:uncharacterized protein YigE (DUF2233 family)